MGLTHHEGISITPIERGGTAFEVTAGTVSISALALGASTVSSTLTVTGNTKISGTLTATAAGKLTNVTKLDVVGTARALGAFVQTGGMNHRIGSAANGVCGIKTIAAASAGSGTVATNRVRATSRIFLTPMAHATNRVLALAVATIASGVSFKITAYRFAGATSGTSSGRVAWQIVNL